MNQNILLGINPNKDTYTWKQLSCTYRAWETAMQFYGDSYVNYFLLCTSFYAGYVDKIRQKKFTDFIDPYNDNFQDILGVRIVKKISYDFATFKNNIVNLIDSNIPVLVPVDLMYLHYNPMYLLEHRYKCMLIKGYDKERELFYILDNIHIDYGASTVLTDFVINEEELFRMFESVCDTTRIEKNIFGLKKEHSLANEIDLFHMIGNFINNNSVGGISKIESDIIELQVNGNADYLLEAHKSVEYIYVFIDQVKKMVDFLEGEKKHICMSIISELQSIRDELDMLRRGALQTKVIPEDEYRHYKEREAGRLESLSNIFMNVCEDDILLKSSDGDKCGTFKVVNNLNAPIKINKDEIVVSHKKGYKYDTWIMQDNAVQILIENPMDGFIESRFSMETGVGEDTHAGFIVHTKDDRTYLFGIVRGEFIALYCPENGAKYSLFEKYNFLADDINVNTFRIEYSGGDVIFKYYDHKLKDMIACYTLDIKIKDIGWFSKTWENIEHRVLIDNISYSL